MGYVFNPFTGTFDSSGSSSGGDVVGPGSATDNAIVRFDGTTGKLIQSSVGLLDDTGSLSGINQLVGATPGGNLEIIGGDQNTSGDAGYIALYGGIGTAGDTNGGNVILSPGSGHGVGTNGEIQLQDAASGFVMHLNLTNLSADRIIAVPNQAGTLALTSDIPSTTAGGDLTGTYPNPTIKASVALTGNPTATTQSFGDSSTKLATTAFVNTAILGQNFKEAAKYASAAALPTVVYDNTAGTLTGSAFGALSIDGNTPSVNDRILIKNQASTFQNGVYTVTVVGGVATLFVLTRATDFNQSNEIKTGDSLFVTAGSSLTSTTWAYTGIDSPTLGTSAITFVQVAGQGSFTGGNGITITGTSIAINTTVTVDKSTAQALTNKDLTGAGNTFPTFNQDTTGKSAKTDALNSASTVVNVAAATAPSSGQVLTATSSTAATWQTPSSVTLGVILVTTNGITTF